MIWQFLATSFKNLVIFGPVTPEYKKGKDVHPVVDDQFGYTAPLLDLAGISNELSGGHYSALFHRYTRIAIPRGPHARLCHAFCFVDSTVYSVTLMYLLLFADRQMWLKDYNVDFGLKSALKSAIHLR